MLQFDIIKTELDMVDKQLLKAYKINAGQLSHFVRIDASPFDIYLRPAIAILSSKLFSQINNQVIALAAVVQFIYIATILHDNINEDNHDIVDQRDRSQFHVLIGDYLYGKSFTSLYNANLMKYTEPLSHAVCSIQEGAILRNTSLEISPEYNLLLPQIIYKEKANLIETSCKLAADLAGANDKDQDIISSFGKEIGMAVGYKAFRIDKELVNEHLKNASHLLNKLPQNTYNRALYELIKDIESNNIEKNQTKDLKGGLKQKGA